MHQSNKPSRLEPVAARSATNPKPSPTPSTAPSRTSNVVQLPPPRHVSVAEQERLLAAARVEDARAYLNTVVKLLAASELEAIATMPQGRQRDTARRAALLRAKQLVQSTQKNAAPARLECLLRLVLATGMRRGEALSLRWSDIDQRSWCAAFRDCRGIGPTYKIPLGLIERLRQITSIDDSRPVLLLDTRALQAHWAAICNRAGVPGLRFMDVRFEALYRARVNRRN